MVVSWSEWCEIIFENSERHKNKGWISWYKNQIVRKKPASQKNEKMHIYARRGNGCPSKGVRRVTSLVTKKMVGETRSIAGVSVGGYKETSRGEGMIFHQRSGGRQF